MQNTLKPVLNEMLVDVFHQILTIQQNRLKKMGVTLSLSEVHVLEAIEKTPLPTMSHIAKRLHITVGSLTTAIKRLVKKGFVIREKDIHDKRKVIVKNTDQAKDVLTHHEAFHASMIDALIENLDESSLMALTDSFKKLTTFFKEIA